MRSLLLIVLPAFLLVLGGPLVRAEGPCGAPSDPILKMSQYGEQDSPGSKLGELNADLLEAAKRPEFDWSRAISAALSPSVTYIPRSQFVDLILLVGPPDAAEQLIAGLSEALPRERVIAVHALRVIKGHPPEAVRVRPASAGVFAARLIHNKLVDIEQVRSVASFLARLNLPPDKQSEVMMDLVEQIGRGGSLLGNPMARALGAGELETCRARLFESDADGRQLAENYAWVLADCADAAAGALLRARAERFRRRAEAEADPVLRRRWLNFAQTSDEIAEIAQVQSSAEELLEWSCSDVGSVYRGVWKRLWGLQRVLDLGMDPSRVSGALAAYRLAAIAQVDDRLRTDERLRRMDESKRAKGRIMLLNALLANVKQFAIQHALIQPDEWPETPYPPLFAPLGE